MGNVVALNRKQRRVQSALKRRDGSSVEGLRSQLDELKARYADTQAMLLAVVRAQGRIRVSREHLLALRDGDSVDAEEDGIGNFTLSFVGH